MQLRKTLAPLVVAAAALTGTLVMPGTASASTGGGCYTASAGGNTVEPCISASGHYAEPDAYIIKNTGCVTAYVDLLAAGSEKLLARHTVSCSTGHKGPFPYLATNGEQLETRVITLDSSSIVIASVIGWSVTVSW